MYPAPWSVQIEPVEGCNRLCAFCGLTATRRAPSQNLKFMTDKTLGALLSGLVGFADRARLEIAMHGEPTLHPAFTTFLRRLRAALPASQIMLTTNGRTALGQMQPTLEGWFAAGLDFVVLDTYRPERDALRAEAVGLRGVRVYDYYKDCLNGGPSPWHNHGRKLRHTLFLLDDISLKTGTSAARVLVNHGGAARNRPVPPQPLQRRCTIPFREVSVCWDGDVCLCCNDYVHEFVCGNVNDTPLEAIWHGPAFAAARALLYAKERSFTPCGRCDVRSGNRPGLLTPQAAPTALHRAAVARVLAATPQRVLLPKVWHDGVATDILPAG